MNQSIAVWNEKQRKINSKEGRRSLSFYGHKYAARKQAVDIDAEFSSIVKSIQGER